MAGLPTNSNMLEQQRILEKQRADALLHFGQLFKQNQKLKQHQSDQSAEATAHWQQVLQLGFPSSKHEDWKYTPLERLLAHNFSFAPAAEVTAAQCDDLSLIKDAHRVVFIDGLYAPELSDRDCGPYQLTPATENTPFPAAIRSEVLLHLTESLAQQRLHIRLPAGKHSDKPLYLLHISSGKGSEVVNTSHYRHHLAIEASAQAEVIEHFVSLNEQPHFTGARLTISVGENAELSHCKLAFETPQSYHFAHNDLVLSRDARAKSYSFLLGAGLTRHNTSAQLNGEGATLSINSLLLPIGREICDTRTYLEHNKGYCESRQLHKTIVRERGKAVFNGMIKVAQHALKTDGQMTNNNLLLSKLAEVDTKPQLEIYADDVKCSHGATVGRIDAEQLFYLQSRGINQADAQQMIIFAFAAELTEAIHHASIRKVVLARIAQRLAGESL
ncbi:cysteine desulfurase activator complex subunit SufD [Yersinia enterocolitica]|uniref:Fe-S cluster assembly protein SufD n=1 Tax=Yersinia enterocolitica TaxID=630 RepID=UPI000281940B|nr:Fe-S cluster assembly protein SufD [Yersinia enterocolitica]AJI82526.1 FeS assembly protein SufD [Yersinia enterocolitica]EKA27941.1 cysteine desulfurase activator complex subunit SufD [Yersinia enterocolitica subsp. enterocolitica WA-314]ELI8283300.1 Fe-S cluster assembly protein SufD [Yersinia enterocolitica]KGA71765.1 FeS assembly protein SufD [Yersinia enterocolitica]KGA78707.1 FeS assembly protein SufD [Yersinia enterocolitica]